MIPLKKIMKLAAEDDSFFLRDLVNYGNDDLHSVNAGQSVGERVQEFQDLGLVRADGSFEDGVYEALQEAMVPAAA